VTTATCGKVNYLQFHFTRTNSIAVKNQLYIHRMESFALTTAHVKWDRSNVTTHAPHQEKGQVYEVFANATLHCMNDLILEGSKTFGNKTFLVDEDGNRMTFAQVNDSATNLSLVLRDASKSGLKAGDRVGVCAKNCFEWAIAFNGASLAGMVVIPMNSWWTPRELEYAVNHAECKMIFADAERVDRLKKITGKCLEKVKVVYAETGGKDSFCVASIHDWVSLGSRLPRLPPTRQNPDEPGMIMYTSGTTNFPKGVVLTHRGICHTGNVYKKINDIFPADANGNQPTALLSVPLFHATGLYAIYMAGLLTGRKIVMMKKWNAAKALELVEREKVTQFLGVPTMVLDMLNHPDLNTRDISTLKAVASGGAAPPAGVAKSITEKMKALPAQGYGLTEVNCTATSISAQDYVERPGSCGKAVPGLSIQIWPDESEVELPRGEVGRVVMRGPTIMLEYLKDPEATKKAITASGWFITGDYGHMDKDGFLFLSGRSQDLIIRGGENISARAVEEVIFATFDDVHECAVFGYPHPTLGEEVGAAVFMKEGRKPLSLEEIRKGCKDQIAGFMLPTGLAIFDEPLPRGATGKTVKKDIKEMLKNGKLKWTNHTKAKL